MSSLMVEATGEVITTMGRAEAETITRKITSELDGIATHWNNVVPLIADALTRQAWAALGYQSAGAYVVDRFGGALTSLPREVRQIVSSELSRSGMSTRAVAEVTGVHKDTVRNDLKAMATGECSPVEPEPPRYDAATGKNFPVEPETQPETIADPAPALAPAWTSASDALNQLHDAAEQTDPGHIIGRNGKTYQRPKKPSETADEIIAARPAAKPKRKPITDQFWEAAYDLDQLANKIQRLTNDDRFNTNRQAISQKNLHALKQTASTLAQVLAALETN